MNKRAQGESTFGNIARIILLLIVLLVLLTTLFMVFFPNIREIILKNAEKFLGLRRDRAIGEDVDDSHIREGIKALVDAAEYARNSPTEGGCLVIPQASLPDDLKGFDIEIQRITGGTNFYLVNPYDQKSSPSYVSGMYPCVVFGRPQVENFYYNWLDGTPVDYKNRKKPEYAEKNIIRIAMSDYLGFDNKLYHRIKLTQLYKADKNHLCFFVDKKVLFGIGGCKPSGSVLTTGCADDISSNIPLCDPSTTTTTTSTTTTTI